MKKRVLIITIVVLFAVGILTSIFIPKETTTSYGKTVKVKTQNLYNSIIVQGSVVGTKRQSIIFSESSNILDIYVSVGQSVKKGDKILLRQSKNDGSKTLQALATKVDSLLSDFGIPSSVTPTVSMNAALVISSTDGVVTKVVAEKNKVFPGYTVAVEISDPTCCTLIAEVPELYISSIRIGQEATVNGPAFDKEVYHGIVSSISQKAQKKIKLTGEGSVFLPVEIELDRADESLKSGCSATIQIRTTEKKNALVLPYDCIIQDESGRELVYCLKEDGGFEIRRVLTGLELKNETEIIYGLNQGDIVVENPNEIINSGGNNK